MAAYSALAAEDMRIPVEDIRLVVEVVVAGNHHNNPEEAVDTSPELVASVAEPSAAAEESFDNTAVALAEEQQPVEAAVPEEAEEVAGLRQQKHRRYCPEVEVLAGSRLAGLLSPDFVDLDYLTSWVFYGSSVCVAS